MWCGEQYSIPIKIVDMVGEVSQLVMLITGVQTMTVIPMVENFATKNRVQAGKNLLNGTR